MDATAAEVDMNDAFSQPNYANYLPDELLLHILNFIPEGRAGQNTIANFCLVSRYVRACNHTVSKEREIHQEISIHLTKFTSESLRL